MPIIPTLNQKYRIKQRKHPEKYVAIIIIIIAVLTGFFVITNRLQKKSGPANTNIIQTNTNKIINKPPNQNKNINKNVNAVLNVNSLNTNTVANTNVYLEGVPPEITKGDSSKKQVIFTFDAGSGNQSARQIIDTLKKYDLKATFFMTGKWAEKNSGLTKEISNAGHEIYNHTYSHPHLTQITDEEIINELQKTETAIKNITGKTTKPFFRPPYGERNSHILEIAAGQGYRSVMWTVDALDWEESTGTTADQVKERVMDKLGPGVIYLMHVGDTLTGKVLDDLIQQTQKNGYTIVPLSQGV